MPKGVNKKICIGNPARGEEFYLRKKLINKAWRMIYAGSNILLAAPRRVGKTSIMCHLLDDPIDDYNIIFVDMESASGENEYFRKLLNKILKSGILKTLQKALALIEKHKPEIKKIGVEGIEFGVKTNLVYFDLVEKVLKTIDESGTKLVIMVDEYPQTLENIIKAGGKEAGIKFLQSNRVLRMDPELNRNITYVYAGSIGLENIIRKINAIATINDLDTLFIPPLKIEEAHEFVKLLLEDVSYDLKKEQINYIINKIKWLIPFHIQLVIRGLQDIIIDEESSKVDIQMIDRIFTEMIEQRNHFDHWHTRLRSSFDSAEYSFAKEILNIVSESETIKSAEMYEIAAKQNLEQKYKEIIASLIYDGYINNNDNENVYRFNSPIVRMWWRKYVAN